LQKPRRNFIECWIFDVIRWHLYRKSDATSEEEFVKILHQASPINHVEQIQVPVLLVHGGADTSVRLEQSRPLQQRFLELSKSMDVRPTFQTYLLTRPIQ
jgi:dipeptidyl aminopeptidase/acylaminoacyl peptidase